ncbi:MAG: hypothetical protein EA397_13660 [Deltaproteobacteria bacterium]|nr:MAG: hypothetical protein EA397_13660 [Deltaproteobacteria bacterium]
MVMLGSLLGSPAAAHCYTVSPDPVTGQHGKVHRWTFALPYHWSAEGSLLPGPAESTVEGFGGQVRWTFDLTEYGWLSHPIAEGTPVVLTLGDGTTVNLSISREVPARMVNRDSTTITVWRVPFDVPVDLAARLARDAPLGFQVELDHGRLHAVFRPGAGRRISRAFACALER